MDTEYVWLRNPETQGVQKFTAESVQVWRDRGWEDADPPADPDIWHDPRPEQPADAEPEQPAAKTKAGRRAATDTPEGK